MNDWWHSGLCILTCTCLYLYGCMYFLNWQYRSVFIKKSFGLVFLRSPKARSSVFSFDFLRALFGFTVQEPGAWCNHRHRSSSSALAPCFWSLSGSSLGSLCRCCRLCFACALQRSFGPLCDLLSAFVQLVLEPGPHSTVEATVRFTAMSSSRSWIRFAPCQGFVACADFLHCFFLAALRSCFPLWRARWPAVCSPPFF
jgi:hypothetical protein